MTQRPAYDSDTPSRSGNLILAMDFSAFVLLADCCNDATFGYRYNNNVVYEIENLYITTKTLISYFDVSISSRDLHQKKLVLSSSES